MPFFTYKKKQVYYEIHGKGDPLLYVHGWNACMDFMKHYILDDLKKKHTVILFDLPGYGKSEKQTLSLEKIAGIIDTLREHVGHKNINVMGTCLGSVFALDYGIRFADKVNKLVLNEVYIYFPWILRPLLIPKINIWLLKFFLNTKMGRNLVRRYLLKKDHQYDKKFFSFFMDSDKQVSVDYIQMLWKYSKQDHAKRAEKIQADTLLIVGEHTESIIKRSAKTLSKHIPKNTFKVLPNSKHFPVEENKEGLREVVSEFINK